jgi:hypothetical protein
MAESRRRRLESVNSTTTSVEFVSMPKYTATDFTTTWKSAGSLNAAEVQKSWKVMLTVAVSCLLAAIAALLGMHGDKRSVQIVVEESTTRLVNEKSKEPKLLIDDALPNILKETPFAEKVIRELKIYHRWFGVIFFYSANFSRAIRVMSLVTSMIVMLFANAVTYNVAYPDDDSCQLYASPAECVTPQSSFSGGSKCYWSYATNSCKFKEPANDLKQVVFVAIIAAVMSTPIAVFADYIIMEYVAAGVKQSNLRHHSTVLMTGKNNRATITREKNTLTTIRKPNSPLQPMSRRLVAGDSNRSSAIATRPVSTTDGGRRSSSERKFSSGQDDGTTLYTTLQEDMSMLLHSLRMFRETLSGDDLKSFEGKLIYTFVF